VGLCFREKGNITFLIRVHLFLLYFKNFYFCYYFQNQPTKKMKKLLNMGIFALFITTLIACGGQQAPKTDEHAGHEMGMDSTQKKQDSVTLTGAFAEIKEGQSVAFGNLKEGDMVKMPLTVKMTVQGMEVEPAGNINADKGHHHILINQDFMKKGEVIPMDSVSLHYGKGQTETELNLPVGKYKLTLQFADGLHRSYGEKMSQTVNIEVKK
jgi:hypothetical protein